MSPILVLVEPFLAWLETHPLLAAHLCALALLALGWELLLVEPAPPRRTGGKRGIEDIPSKPPLCRPKEPWVREAVLRLKALMPDLGCRKIADAFNGMYHGRESVGKTFVADAIRDHGEAILRVRREIKHRKPRPLPRNRIWGIDLTFLPGREKPILGIVDHGARALILLTELDRKSSLSILRCLIGAARKFGLPHSIRTDNERSLCSFVFRAALRLLGIRHKAIAPHSPWQNGRIERLFGTFKERMLTRLAELRAAGREPASFQAELATFRLWYNHVRTHQHLDGLTPAEAWDGLRATGERKQPRRHFVSVWEGLLTGFH